METFYFNNVRQTLGLGHHMSEWMHEAFRKDGRLLGNLAESFLDAEFLNLEKKDDNEYYDMDTPDKRRVEVRCIGQSRFFSFDASTNVGKGRDGTDLAGTLYKLDNVTDWIFLDAKTFPNVDVYHVSGEKIRAYYKANPTDKNYRRVPFKTFIKAFFSKGGYYA